MAKQKTIYELGLHECAPVDPFAFYVMRVPGGWLYCSQSHHAVPPVFVPYSEEFLPKCDHNYQGVGCIKCGIAAF